MINFFNINTFNPIEGKLDSLILIRLRWFMCALLAAMAMILAITAQVQSEEFIKVIFVLMIATLFNNVLENQFKKKEKIILSNFWQLFLDLILTTIVFYFLGGIENPTYFIILLIPMIAPLFVKFKESLVILISCFWALTLQIWSPYQQTNDFIPSPLKQFGIYIVLIVSFALMSWLSYLLEQTGKKFQNMLKQNMRVDGLKAMGALSSSFCHELGTPFATIRICLDRLREGRGSEIDIELMRNSFSQCELSLQTMMSTGLDPREAKFTETSINELMEQTISHFSEEDDAQIIIHALAPYTYNIPKLPFTKMLVDLIENSLEARATQVDIEISESKEKLQILIIDNGEGVSKQVLDQIGTPFNTTKEQGTGIGLYNAKTLLEMLGGSLELKRKDSGGTIVELNISRSLKR